MSKDEKKITKLTNEYTKEQYAEFQKQRRQVIFKRRRMAVICVIALAAFSFAGFQLYSDYQRLSDLKSIRADTQLEADTVSENVENLQASVKLLKDDEYVTKLARSRFFYSRDGEQVYVLPDNTTDSTTNSSAEDSATSAESTDESSNN